MQTHSRIYKKTNCLICGFEFQKESATHKFCSDQCRLEYRKIAPYEQKKASREQRRRWYLKSEYGLQEGEWEQLFEKQNHRCAICLAPKPGNKNGWCTDHDHRTGKVRGILCHKCNTDVGGYDRVISNPSAIRYVQ